MDIIQDLNNRFTHPHAYEKVYQKHHELKFGQIVNVQRNNHLGLTYSVKLFDAGGLILENCKLASTDYGFNGTGTIQPLNEGTPVALLSKMGMLQESLIIGAFTTEGNYKDYYQQGNLQKPGQTEEGIEFNQPLGHPNRITQEDSYFQVIGGKTIGNDYDSPEYYIDPEKRSQAQPTPSSITLKNQGGDAVQYTLGTNITYSEGNIIQFSGGDREQRVSKLLRYAAMHTKRAELIQKFAPLSVEEAEQKKTKGGMIPLVSSKTSEVEDVISSSYRIEQERKLAELYAEAAKNQNQVSTARLTSASELQNQFGSELGNKVKAPSQVGPNWNPPKEKGRVAPSNYGKRSSKDVNGNSVKNKLLVVIHETVIDAADTLSAFSNPNTEASYHALIKRDGTVIELVSSEDRAFGAANSAFNGEQVSLSSNPASVNNFAYHISLESPADGRGNNPSHSGYTEQQYYSLALTISKTGVDSNRITTHAVVDKTGDRKDPRSFDFAKFNSIYASFPKKKELSFGEGIE